MSGGGSLAARAAPRAGGVRRGITVTAVAALTAAAGATATRPATSRAVHRARFAAGGPTAQHRLGPGRESRSTAALPTEPRVTWAVRVDVGVAHAPAVDGRGRVILAGMSSALVQLAPDGKREWALALDSGVEAAPVVLADGTRAVALAEGSWLRVSARGVELGRTPMRLVGALAPPLVRAHGAVVLAAGTAAVELDADGALVRRSVVADRVRGVVEDGGRVLLVGASGRVWAWPESRPPTEVGSFGLAVDEAVRCGAARLCAAATSGALHELDVRSGEVRRRVRDPALGAFATPAVLAGGGTLVLTTDGLLVSHDASGQERSRAAIAGPEAGGASLWLPPVVDGRGSAAFVRARADVGVARASGEVRYAPDSACDDPVGLVPAPDGGLVLACRAGRVVRLASSRD
ncbi:MAG: hypothetical protein IT376_01565 [Polyangiaceae bacterium]|nr:hypothetical protein [Polyangiaceae bacterium]